MTKKSKEPIKWKVTSSKAFHMNRKIMKPNQIVTLKEEDIPEEYRRYFESADKKEEDTSTPTLKRKDLPYYISKVEDVEGDFYNVENSKGKVVNDMPLTNEQAKDLLKSLN